MSAVAAPDAFRTPEPSAILTPLDLLSLARRKPIHFMGIGGAGMLPLAELVRRNGGSITGCDSSDGVGSRAFRELGVPVEIGHSPDHLVGCGALVVTAAVRADHPEIAAARAAGIPVLKRAEALGAIVNRGTVVGISGTHGKTTTTALTTAALAAGGLDPTGLVGGRVPAWNGNLRLGGDRLFVVEADEYDRSFHTLRPSIGVITTLEADHLDIYGSLAGVEEAFHTFLSSVPEDGLIIGCGDDPGVGRLLPRLVSRADRLLTYGLNAGSMLRAEEVRSAGVESQFEVRERGRRLGRVRLQVPGAHNVRNALAAIAVARHLDVGWDSIVEGLGSYSGVQRRFERIGEERGILVIDDYAHHPTELEATLRAARDAFPGRRLVAVFQPHLFSRTRDFAEEFGRALALADRVFVTDIYPAREKPIPGVTGELLIGTAGRAGADVSYLPVRDEVVEQLIPELRSGDVCLMLGAGDLDEAARQLVAGLRGGTEAGTHAR
ncbi:MAG TPA: UDP-N-acetylmuramate--L-alanine ligase [Longimicrobiaceae bacterium]|nr:UDP-N-acetylmuramate--L-alanine ligase [Longimicrobium sp.]